MQSTTNQKISISLPPEILEYAEQYTAEKGLSSRSDFFVAAAKALREQELSEGYRAFADEYHQHPERFDFLQDGSDGLEPSDGSEWL
jgi:Arc/MetJ-type ribon-helix-helix transcriptional regulator